MRQQDEDAILYGILGLFTVGMIVAVLRKNIVQIDNSILGEFFPWDDMVVSDVASQYNLTDQWNPPEDAKDYAQHLAQIVLDPVRRFLGLPIITNSWWRSQQLNDKLIELGYYASPTSWHMTGGAADCTIWFENEFRNDLLLRGILMSGVPFKRLLIEFGTDDRPGWIQVEYDRNKLPWNQDQIILRTYDGDNWFQWDRDYAEQLYA